MIERACGASIPGWSSPAVEHDSALRPVSSATLPLSWCKSGAKGRPQAPAENNGLIDLGFAGGALACWPNSVFTVRDRTPASRPMVTDMDGRENEFQFFSVPRHI
jgi:hypothetical protein